MNRIPVALTLCILATRSDGLVSKDAAAELLALEVIVLSDYKKCDAYIQDRKDRAAAAIVAEAKAKEDVLAAAIAEEARKALESSSEEEAESSSEEESIGDDDDDEEEEVEEEGEAEDSEDEWLKGFVSPEERARREEQAKADRMKLRNRDALTHEMIEAAASGDIATVREILTTVGPASVKDSRIRALAGATIKEPWGGVNVLMAASRYGQAEVVAYLLSDEIACDAELGDADGTTALMWAARSGHPTACKALEAGGCNLDAVDLQQRTALAHAALAGRHEVVKHFSYTKADMNRGDAAGATALMHAADLGHTDIVKSLVAEDGCDVDRADKGRRTALMRAARWGHLQCLRLLLEEDADADARDKQGWTALMFAARWNKVDAARCLALSAEAELNIRERSTGRTALIFAASKGHSDVVKILLEAEANAHVRDIYGDTALELAVGAELAGMIEERQQATAPSENEAEEDDESDDDSEAWSDA